MPEAANIVPVSIYTEMTPNPESMKFVANKLIYPDNVIEFKNEEEAKASPLATELFGFPFVRSVFFSQNYITLSKDQEADWNDIIPEIKEFIRNYLETGGAVVEQELVKVEEAEDEIKGETSTETSDPEIVNKIIEVLDTYIKPAIEMDGGHIKYKSFSQGVLTLVLQGACSGCPSATVTLKAGIEGMMNRMVPEVKEVVAEEL